MGVFGVLVLCVLLSAALSRELRLAYASLLRAGAAALAAALGHAPREGTAAATTLAAGPAAAQPAPPASPPAPPRGAVGAWSCAEVGAWLRSVELGEHAAAFAAASVDGALLQRLGPPELASLGVASPLHAKKIRLRLLLAVAAAPTVRLRCVKPRRATAALRLRCCRVADARAHRCACAGAAGSGRRERRQEHGRCERWRKRKHRCHARRCAAALATLGLRRRACARTPPHAARAAHAWRRKHARRVAADAPRRPSVRSVRRCSAGRGRAAAARALARAGRPRRLGDRARFPAGWTAAVRLR
jgi:hypothetical protein